MMHPCGAATRVGLTSARQQLQELAGTTRNECFVVHLPTKEVVARLNLRSFPGLGRKPVVFQIAYDGGLASARTGVLRLTRLRGSFGYR